MSKNIIVNGKTYNGVSFLQLLTTEGVSALFKDMDEVGGGMPGLAEVTSGTFTVEAATVGNTDPSNAGSVIVEHGMSAAPDGYAVFPKYWYDTMDRNLICTIRAHGRNAVSGRRAIEGDVWQSVGSAVSGDVTATCFYPLSASYAQFQPNYIDNAGNQGQQVYIWIAWRNAE